MTNYTTHQYDIVIIGAGGAGLRAAIESSADPSVKVAIVCKSLLGKAHTVMAEGGAAAALGNVDSEDNWQVHFRDTMKGGKMLNNWRMAQIHAQESPDRIRELEQWGAVFDRTPEGLISQRPFGGHSFARLAHVGDRTGLEMIRTLQDHTVHQRADVFMEYTVTKLLKDGDRVSGLLSYDRNTGDFHVFNAKAVVMATGGCCRCYLVQTNSWEGTGDGHALAYEAGAELMDMEFLQFHPTGMVWPLGVKGLLVTEGVRGDGGILKNSEGDRFMFKYIPDAFKNDVADNEEEANRWALGDRANNRKPPELLTRDVVARAINTEVKAGRGSEHGGVILDIASQRDPEFIRRKLPSMYHQFKELAGVDITKEAMEIGPTAHYIMGGIKVNADTCESTVPGLFAAGEVAAGLHGANRLGGNSLSDLVVFGKRAGEYALKLAKSSSSFPAIPTQVIEQAISEASTPFSENPSVGENPFTLQKELHEIMGSYCGIIRTDADIRIGISKIEELKKRVPNCKVSKNKQLNTGWHAALDMRHLIVVSEMLARAALERTESRGGHTREDFPEYDPVLSKQNIILKKDAAVMTVNRVPLPEMPTELQTIIADLDK